MSAARAVLMGAALIALLVPLAGQGPAPRAAGGAARFVTVGVSVDAGPSRLAAWQLDIRGEIAGGEVELVGIEGGDAGPFAEPAFYDPAALAGRRVVLAAFSTADPATLPAGRTRVARLHLRVTGGGEPNLTVEVIAAADAAGARIDATAAAAREVAKP